MIIYTVICRAKDAAILVECADRELAGNAPQVTAMLMGHLRDHPDILLAGERKTFVQQNNTSSQSSSSAQQDLDNFFSMFMDTCASAFGEETEQSIQDEHYFHIILKGGVFFCCIGDDPDFRDQKVNFAFLEQISEEFLKRHRTRRIENCNAYALDKNFQPTVRSAVHYHNVNHKSIAQEERVQKLQGKLVNLQQVMGRNIDLLLERGEKFDALLQKSDTLEEDAAVFKKKSVVIKRRTRRKYYFMMAFYGFIGLVLLYFFTAGVCGVGFQYCKARGGGDDDNAADGNNNNNNNAGNGGGGGGN